MPRAFWLAVLGVLTAVLSLLILTSHRREVVVTRVRSEEVAPTPSPKPPTPRPSVRVVTVRPKPVRRPVRASGSPWDCIARYESGGNWAYNDGFYEGGLNFMHSTWVAAGGRRYAEHAYQATREQQIAIASSWLARTSWAQWPNTSRKCGYR